MIFTGGGGGIFVDGMWMGKVDCCTVCKHGFMIHKCNFLIIFCKVKYWNHEIARGPSSANRRQNINSSNTLQELSKLRYWSFFFLFCVLTCITVCQFVLFWNNGWFFVVLSVPCSVSAISFFFSFFVLSCV